MLVGHLRRPRPRRHAPLVRAARALWTLPTNLLGHLAGLLASGGRLPRRVGGPAAVGWLYPIRSGLGLDWVGAVTSATRSSIAPASSTGRRRPRASRWRTSSPTRASTTCSARSTCRCTSWRKAASALLTRGQPITVSRVHDLNPLEQTFIAISSSALYAPRASDDDVADVLADFGV